MSAEHQNVELILFEWVAALRSRDPSALADHLAPDVVWQGLRSDLVCRDRNAVLHNIAGGGPHRERVTGIEVVALDEHRVLLGAQLPSVTELFGEPLDGAIYDVFTITAGIIARIDEFKTRQDAVTFAQTTPAPASSAPTRAANDQDAGRTPAARRPWVERVVPILNVSDIRASFTWFAKLGWQRGFEWSPNPSDQTPGFGSVETGNCEIFLCRDGQGSRGKGTNQHTFGPDGAETSDKGVWMSIWVDDVDAVHQRATGEGLDITHPPTDEPWGVREMHVRHPDGHVFRISANL
jgi:catechol 2,3-dioxygenase-like lactoylglutathione lyase family enzyme